MSADELAVADLPEATALRPRVIHVINDLRVGGAERMLAALALADPTFRKSIIAVTLSDGGHFTDVLREAGIAVVELGFRRNRPNLGGIIRLARLIRRLRPVAIQSWMYYADLVTLIAWQISGRKRNTHLFWGIRCSNLEAAGYGVFLRMTIRICSLFSGFPEAIVTNSEAGRQVHQALGYHPRRFVVIDNGVDLETFRPDPVARRQVREVLGLTLDMPVVALVARVDPMKDHKCFLAAFSQVSGARALLVGKGTQFFPERPGIRCLGERLDVPSLLAACDIIVSSSAFGEGFSNAIAEGMATGCVPVVTDVGDSRRIVGEAGLVVPPRDPAALAAAIQSLVDDPDRRRSLSEKSRARIASQFPLQKFVSAFNQLY